MTVIIGEYVPEECPQSGKRFIWEVEIYNKRRFRLVADLDYQTNLIKEQS